MNEKWNYNPPDMNRAAGDEHNTVYHAALMTLNELRSYAKRNGEVTNEYVAKIRRSVLESMEGNEGAATVGWQVALQWTENALANLGYKGKVDWQVICSAIGSTQRNLFDWHEHVSNMQRAKGVKDAIAASLENNELFSNMMLTIEVKDGKVISITADEKDEEDA